MKKKHLQGGHITDCKQALLRRRVLTVLRVCVAACVLAVCVATVMVVDLARKWSLVLFNTELMVRGGSAERETEDNRVSFHLNTKQERWDSKRALTRWQMRLLALRPETRKHKKRPTRQKCFSVYFQRSSVPKGIARYQDESTDCNTKTLATLSVNSLIYIRNVLITMQCLFKKPSSTGTTNTHSHAGSLLFHTEGRHYLIA